MLFRAIINRCIAKSIKLPQNHRNSFFTIFLLTFVRNKNTSKISLLAMLTSLSRQHIATREFGAWLNSDFCGFLAILRLKNPFPQLFLSRGKEYWVERLGWSLTPPNRAMIC
jgi:hypothetical protein